MATSHVIQDIRTYAFPAIRYFVDVVITWLSHSAWKLRILVFAIDVYLCKLVDRLEVAVLFAVLLPV